jgi:hypothetical protein
MISDADRVAAVVVAVIVRAEIATTTGIAGRVRMAVVAATDIRTMDAGIGISVVDAGRVDKAVRETRVIAVRAGTISSRADRCARRSYQSQQIQKV